MRSASALNSVTMEIMNNFHDGSGRLDTLLVTYTVMEKGMECKEVKGKSIIHALYSCCGWQRITKAAVKSDKIKLVALTKAEL